MSSKVLLEFIGGLLSGLGPEEGQSMDRDAKQGNSVEQVKSHSRSWERVERDFGDGDGQKRGDAASNPRRRPGCCRQQRERWSSPKRTK